ncbi:MAG: hypothetical protein WBF52_17380 [Geitlerinemataceae cyanobacterium]
MPFKLKSLFETVRSWFPKASAEIEAQAVELEAKLTEDPLPSLPPQELNALRHRIHNLPKLPCDRTAILSALEDALDSWGEDRESVNSLVILGSPINEIAPLLVEALETWDKRDSYAIEWGERSHRPQDWMRLPEELRSQLSAKVEEKRPSIVMIPDLSQCFLRCVEGLKGIEYLQNLAAQDRDRFWLIGCNDWAWQYLDCVCQTSAYFDRTFSLPPLEQDELKDWLSPVSNDFQVDVGEDSRESDESKKKDDLSQKWRSSSEQDYFEKLATVSRGVSGVAAELWLLSLSPIEEELEGKKSSCVSSLSKQIKLPDLPSLSQVERHLLYALLLQGQISLSHLAVSLDETESFVRARIGVLRRSGLLRTKNREIHVNPAHFFRLNNDLKNNRFLVGE